MEKQVDLRHVHEAIRQLREAGERVSRRSVQGLVGGSMTTVHRLLDEALAAERALAAVQTASLSDTLVRTMLGEIAGQVQGATEALETRLSELAAREQEILNDLEGSEARAASLEQQLNDLQAQFAGERQAAEKATAVALEQQASLREQLDKLEAENNNLIRAGETARTESAKAQLQVERADLAAKKAEERVLELEAKVADLTGSVKEAEKRAAVAERHAQDLTVQSASQTEMLQQSAIVIDQLRQELAVAVKAEADADKKAALAEQHSESQVRELEGKVADLLKAKQEAEKVAESLKADVEKGTTAANQLRVELAEAVKTAATSDKKAALAEQKLSMMAAPVSPKSE